MIRADLSGEAIRLGWLVRALMSTGPGSVPPPEATGLLALMLLHDARRDARVDEAGDIVLLEEQDRRRWNRQQIGEAQVLVTEALRSGAGPYTLQAAIAAEHCKAARAEDTNWREIARLFGELERLQPSPIVLLNRGVAVAMAEGPQTGLAIVNAIGASGDLADYHLFHATRADLLRRLGSHEEAARDYRRALELVTNDRERRYLERRLQEVSPASR